MLKCFISRIAINGRKIRKMDEIKKKKDNWKGFEFN
jgi:hypothetical protein